MSTGPTKELLRRWHVEGAPSSNSQQRKSDILFVAAITMLCTRTSTVALPPCLCATALVALALLAPTPH
eukprot:COSAG05_NODE_13096_length_441_cov_27.242690_1_plen_68_part_10